MGASERGVDGCVRTGRRWVCQNGEWVGVSEQKVGKCVRTRSVCVCVCVWGDRAEVGVSEQMVGCVRMKVYQDKRCIVMVAGWSVGH